MKNYLTALFIVVLFCTFSACSKQATEPLMDSMNTSSVTPTISPASSPTITPTASPQVQVITVTPTVNRPAENDYNNKKLVALTFDDGPNTDITPLILDKLEQYNIVASFFLIGKNVNIATVPIMERQLQLNCEINNHSWSHPYMNSLSADEIISEVNDTSNIILEGVGVEPKFFRPPYIATSVDMYINIDLPFICGIGCNDWDPTFTADQRAETIISTVKDGDIILLHDSSGNYNTVNALDQIIPTLLDEGYAFVTVSKLFELKGIDPNIEYKIWTNMND